MRCPDCRKFVPFDTELEPQEEQAPALEEETLTASYRRVLACAECGTELKEAMIEFQIDISTHVAMDPCSASETEQRTHSWSLVSCEATPMEDMKTTDRRGRKITKARYMTKLYGVEVSAAIKCDACGEEESFAEKQSEAALAFEEMV